MIEWIRESGRAEADADYILSLPIVGWRRRELARLGEVYGVAHRKRVEEYVKSGWSCRDKAAMVPVADFDGDARGAALRLVRG